MLNFILGGVSACNPSRFSARSQVSKVHSRERFSLSGLWELEASRGAAGISGLASLCFDKSLKKLSLVYAW